MKRIIALAVLAVFVLGLAGVAAAAELKVTGEFKAEAKWDDNTNFQNTEEDSTSEDDFSIRERARIIFRYAASDTLSGVIRLEYGTWNWGNPNFGIVGSEAVAVEIKRAYLEFYWPGTEILFQAGHLSLALPNVFGSAIIGDDTDTFLVTSPITDNVSFLAGFARAVDLFGSDGANNVRDEWDHIFLAVPLSFDGLSLTPFFDFSILGNGIPAAGADALAPTKITTPGNYLGGSYDDKYVYPWWAGVSLDFSMFDPFVVKGEFNYGSIDDGENRNDRSGYLADLELAYTGLDLFVPKLFGVYTSGEDDNTSNGSERMPTISEDWAWGTYWYGGSSMLNGDLDNPVVGTWAVGVALTDISFIEKLSHDFYFLAIGGTNDHKLIDKAPGYLNYGMNLTDKDMVYEFDFNHKYQIYEELAAILELSYVVNDIDKSTWNVDKQEDAWKIGFGLQYFF